MKKTDFEFLCLRIHQLQEVAHSLQEQIDLVDAEVRITLSFLTEERDSLRWRVDPYSSNATSLADCDEI